MMRQLEFADICPSCKNILFLHKPNILYYIQNDMQPELSGEFEIGAFIMEKFRVGIIGATGMVGQRFVLLTANHPWFTPVVLAASAHSAGKTYAQAIEGKWHMAEPIPESVKSMIVMDAEADAEEIARQVDFVFCAVNMKKDEIKALEEKYAKLECPVVSNNSAHRHTPDVPMVVPINADHIRIIDAQRKRLGTKRGFIAVKSIAACKAMSRHCTR